VIGPLTFEQFVYLLGGGALAYMSYRFMPKPFGFVVAAAVAGLACLLAFYKVNNRPFIDFLASFISFHTKGRKYSWRKVDATPAQQHVSTPLAPAPLEQTRYDITTVAQGLDVLDRTHEYEHSNTTIR
jgi:hypothetical protein